MAKVVLIDSGPIVAALCARDQHHEWAKLQFEALSESCSTCEAVLSESFFLLSRTPGGTEKLCALLDRGILKTDFSLDSNLSETTKLMRRYSDTPMSFADACLVRMAEMQNNSVVFTTDRDFETYRKNGRKVIPLAKPW
jgi:predicted nucleic acid-binding protein